jgi:hypothetical protein
MQPNFSRAGLKNMTSLILDLQRDALDSNIRVSDLLRKALVAARKLGIKDFEAWINLELNGYVEWKNIPTYRMLQGQIEAWNPFYGWQPVIFEDPEYAKALSSCSVSQSIGEIEATIGDHKPQGRLIMSLPQETEYEIIQGLDLTTKVSRRVSAARIVNILDAVRNIILGWSLKLEQDGILGEGLAFSDREKEIAAQGIYLVNNFYASATIQQGNISSSQITAQNDVTVGGDVTGRDKTVSGS